MEEKMTKNYVFNAFDSKGNEISLVCANIFYGITEEEAKGIRIGLYLGLCQKYKNPKVICREATEEEEKEDREIFAKAFGF